MPVRTSGPTKTAEQLEKLVAKENWHKLVVKILIWKDGKSSNNINLNDRITEAEWKTYSKVILTTNTTYGKEKVLSNLSQIRETIQRNGGFE